MNSASARGGDEKPSDLPPAASDSWRTWVMTGARRAPIDRRRVRGEHRGLKKMLVEGLNGGGERAHPWTDFSSAMIRHSVDEAVNSLPDQDRQIVKLAYFGGLSNREIASRLGIPIGGVRRRLREAMATVSGYVERGRMAGRRVVFAIGGWLTARSVVEGSQRASSPLADQVVHAAAALTVGVVAAAVLVSNPASPPSTHVQTGGGTVRTAAPAADPLHVAKPGTPNVAVPPVPVSAPSVPATPPVPALPDPGSVKLPPLPLPVPVNATPPANLPVPRV